MSNEVDNKSFEGFDHRFMVIGRLGSGVDSRVIGGDIDTWGEGAEEIGEINLFLAQMGSGNNSLIFIKNDSIDNEGWDEYNKVAKFIKSHFSVLSDDEADFILWHLSGMCLGENLGIFSYQSAGEINIVDEGCNVDDTEGSLIVHVNTRYNCNTLINNDGEAEWLDEIEPDDLEQGVAILLEPKS